MFVVTVASLTNFAGWGSRGGVKVFGVRLYGLGRCRGRGMILGRMRGN